MKVEFQGQPILVEFRPHLRAWRGKLVSGGARGAEVHAGSFLRERRIVLDRAILRNARERDRILAHEILHFVWWKIGWRVRASWELLLKREFAAGVTGEMGWSAEWRKARLIALPSPRPGRGWKEYCCESFCDTVAAQMVGLSQHDEITLSAAAKPARRRWVEEFVDGRSLRI